MTNIATPSVITSDSINSNSADAAMPDPRQLFAVAVRTARATLAAVSADQFDGPTPCDAFDVRQLAGHLVAVLHRVAVIGSGGDPFDAPTTTTGVADDELIAVFDAHHEHAAAVWADADLNDIVTVPWAQLPGAIALTIYTSEVTVHTWDLAVATAQQPDWDAEVVTASLMAMQRGLPDEGRMESFAEAGADVAGSGVGSPPPFHAAVPTRAEAPMIAQLVAWCGRTPV